MLTKMPLAGAVVAAILAILSLPKTTSSSGLPNSRVPGNEACSACHSEIYKSYIDTAMGKASGEASDGLITGEFDDKNSGVHYRVYEELNRVWMSYDRKGDDEFRGRRQLLYYIGSGRKGRTYVFSVDGFFFETPINWYSQEHRWNMTPAYTESRESPMNLPLFSSCLNCHASGLQSRIPGTKNRFSGAPFVHDGITCERCHGDGETHAGGKGPIVNPARLRPQLRDSICMECHFEGTVAVEQPGKRIDDFEPGDDLLNDVHYFVLSGKDSEKPQALSQFEALSLSACKRKSADKMWCGTCHDAHREPKPAERAAYFREKCLSCHGKNFAARHHADNPDCVQCHMPTLPSQDVAHTESTDHRIRKYPMGAQVPAGRTEADLEVFPSTAASRIIPRDYALAWGTLEQRGVTGAGEKAERYLQKALQLNPDDRSLLSALAYIEQERGNEKRAGELYERILKLRPEANTAAANLGAIEARAGNLKDAVKLWEQAFNRVPYRSAIGMNLALAFCESGQTDEARRDVLRVLEFNPDYGKAKRFWAHLNSDPAQCKF